MKQRLKSYIELIVLFVHLIKRNHLWPKLIRRGKQILLKQNHLCPPPPPQKKKHLYFIILCYKGRKNTIVPGGSQFTRYNLSVLPLCLNYHALFVFRPWTEFMSFFPYFNYNSTVC